MSEFLLFTLGIISGTSLILLIALLWAALAGPVQEWIWETVFDRPQVGNERDSEELRGLGKPIVLISDIHMDTWDLTPQKFDSFREFLAHVRASGIKEVYLNGDLMDVPPHPLNQRDVPNLTVDYQGPQKYFDLNEGPLGILQPELDSTFVALNQLVDPNAEPPQTVLTYLTGNHDIGVEGLRYIRPDLSWSSVRVAWNPAVMLKLQPESWIYIEHGHRYDPFLWLYLRYAILQLLRSPGSPALAQREGKLGMGQNKRLTKAPTSAEAFAWEWLDTQGRLPGDTPDDQKETVGMKLAKYQFRHSARRRLRMFPPEVRDCVKAISFGHTHIPDQYVFPGGCHYVNSGDWAGNELHQCYVLIYPDGSISRTFQWRGPASAHF